MISDLQFPTAEIVGSLVAEADETSHNVMSAALAVRIMWGDGNAAEGGCDER